MKRLALAALAVLWASAAWAGSPVAVCGLSGTSGQSDCIIPNSDGSINIGTGGGGTASINLSQVGGAAVDIGVGAAGGGTLRVAPASETLVPLGTFGTPATTGVVSVQGGASMTPIATTQGAATTGGCTTGYLQAGVSTNSTSITGQQSTLCTMSITNTNTTIYYLLVFNKATAPTCNSDTPKHIYPIPPAGASGGVGGLVVGEGAFGEDFPLGFGVCITAAAAGTGNAATGIFLNYSTK